MIRKEVKPLTAPKIRRGEITNLTVEERVEDVVRPIEPLIIKEMCTAPSERDNLVLAINSIAATLNQHQFLVLADDVRSQTELVPVLKHLTKMGGGLVSVKV